MSEALFPVTWQNGNATVTTERNGTRSVMWDGDLKLEYPLNVDIRVSTQCEFGRNPKTGKAVCSFCHESAVTDGTECDYGLLLQILTPLPAGVELAIGMNQYTDNFHAFLGQCKLRGWIVNVTINQGHLKKWGKQLALMIDEGVVAGVGVSFRPNMAVLDSPIVTLPNTVVHVIAGIDDFDRVSSLADSGVKKLLVLGEKDFGFNKGKVIISSPNHLKWKWKIHTLFSLFDVVSFDNLALQQLNVKRFFTDKDWATFYQGEHSFYINAAEGYFSPSSRSPQRVSANTTNIVDYFHTLSKEY
jgi:hypothetical protein